MGRKVKTGPKKKVADPATVEQYAAEGLAKCQIAKRLGMCQDTFTKCNGASPSIVEVLE